MNYDTDMLIVVVEDVEFADMRNTKGNHIKTLWRSTHMEVSAVHTATSRFYSIVVQATNAEHAKAQFLEAMRARKLGAMDTIRVRKF